MKLKLIMKKVFISLISLAMLYSCSDNESSLLEKGLSNDIKVHATVEKMTVVKSVISSDNVNGVNFLRVDQATNSVAPSDFGSATTPLTGNMVNGNINFLGTTPEYQHNNYYAYMVAYWPAGTMANKNITWDIDGKTDILLSNVWCAGNYTNPIENGMVFEHQLSRLQVICKAQAGVALEAVQDTWGQITSIEIVGVKPQLQLNTTNEAVISTGNAQNAALLQSDYNTAFEPIAIPASGNTTINAATMQAPIALSNEYYSLQLLVKTTKKPEGVTINVALKSNTDTKIMSFDAGKINTVTLTFKSTDKVIEVSSTTITPWTEGYIASNDVVI